MTADLLDAQPLPGELLDEFLRSRMPEHAPGLRRQHPGITQLASVRSATQFRVRDRVPEEVGETRGQFMIGEGPHAAFLLARDAGLHAELWQSEQ